jgi:DNA-binding NarL/FixJ family response regulator
MNRLTGNTTGRTAIEAADTARDIRVAIVAYRDFSTDALESMLTARDSRLTISCIEPQTTCDENFLADIQPHILMIQKEALCPPAGRSLQKLMADFPDTRILVFGKDMDDDQLHRFVRDGAHGYINERMNGDHIRQALSAVLAGGFWIERRIMERFINAGAGEDDSMERRIQKNIRTLCDLLTRREIEVLRQVIRGLPIKRIAEEVHLSDQGVKIHLAKLFKKLGVSNRNQLILAAFDRISPVDDLSDLLFRNLTVRLAEQNA